MALGSARPRDGTPVLLLMALYWLGVSADTLRLAWMRRRGAKDLRDDLRVTLRDLVLVVNAGGCSTAPPIPGQFD